MVLPFQIPTSSPTPPFAPWNLALKAAENSLETITMEWIEARRCAWSPRYAKVIETRLREDIFPSIGHEAVSEIYPQMLLTAHRKIMKSYRIILNQTLSPMDFAKKAGEG